MSDFFVGEKALKSIAWEEFEPSKSWLQNNIVLTDGAERGQFRIDTAPHVEEVLDDADKHSVKRLTLMWASQTTKTTIGLGLLFKNVATSYDNGFVMFPTANKLPLLIKFKFTPQLNGCPILKERIETFTQDEGDRKNSFIYNTGRNLLAVLSVANTKSITTRWMLYDECAEMPIETINEADERAKTYSTIGYKSIRTSTQIHKNDSINHSFLSSEVKKRRYFVCPECQDLFYPMPENLKYTSLEEFKESIGKTEQDTIPYHQIMSDYAPMACESPALECPHCYHQITDEERVDLILGKKLVWKQVSAAEDEDGNILYEIAENEKTEYESVGFDINTMCIHNVPMSEFVRKTIECEYAEPYMKDDLYDKFYVGYWNILYVPKSIKKTKKDDILLLDNGVPFGVVPKNTNALHIGVDLQKDRLYYSILGVEYADDIVGDIIEYGELYSDGIGNDFKQLTEIIEDDYYDEDGEHYKISSVGIDYRGFSLKDKDSRSNEALDYIFDYAIKLKEYGVIGWDNFIYPMYGVDKLESRHEPQGYKVVPIKRDVFNDDGEKQTVTIKSIAFSNLKIKTILFAMIERSILKAKADPEAINYDRRLLNITNGIVEDYEKRQSLPQNERRDKHSLEAHLTSEHLTYKITKGKPAKEMSYEKKYESVRNDWLDTTCMEIVQSLLLDTYREQAPSEEDGGIDAFDALSGLN